MTSIQIKGVPERTHAVLRKRATARISRCRNTSCSTSSKGDTARARLRGEELAAPELVDLGVTSLRGLLRVGKVDERRAARGACGPP